MAPRTPFPRVSRAARTTTPVARRCFAGPLRHIRHVEALQWCENGDASDGTYYDDNRVFSGAAYGSSSAALGSAVTYSGSSTGGAFAYAIHDAVPTYFGTVATKHGFRPACHQLRLLARLPRGEHSFAHLEPQQQRWNTTGSNTPRSDGKNHAAYSDPGLATTGSFTVPTCFVNLRSSAAGPRRSRFRAAAFPPRLAGLFQHVGHLSSFRRPDSRSHQSERHRQEQDRWS